MPLSFNHPESVLHYFWVRRFLTDTKQSFVWTLLTGQGKNSRCLGELAPLLLGALGMKKVQVQPVYALRAQCVLQS